MDAWHIELLDKTHQRADFCCGKAPLDDFLRTKVSQYEKRKLGRTFVAVRPGEKQVLGYFTLAAGSLSFAQLPPASAKKLPKHPIPVVLLARLAVDQSVQGRGLGVELLLDALTRCRSLAGQLGIHAVEVDGLDESARAFYLKYGFASLEDNPLHLYLPLATIDAVLTKTR